MAVALAHHGTIINADSAQVYADLSVLSARPSLADEAGVPHRLFGHVDAADTGYSAARWAGEARTAIDQTLAQGRLPVLVGGTGLYLRTLLDGIAPVPTIPPEIRDAVRALPVAEAHAALARSDPEAAARLNAADTTRVARALEVIRATGRPLSDWQAQKTGGIGYTIALAPVILLPDRDWLFARIDARTAAMMQGGAVQEVAALLARDDLPADAPIRRAIGVAPIAACLDGAMPRDVTTAAIALATRQYAKRQYTWFRRQPPESWLRAADHQTAMQQFETLLR